MEQQKEMESKNASKSSKGQTQKPMKKVKNPKRVAAAKKAYQEGRSGLNQFHSPFQKQQKKQTNKPAKKHPLQQEIEDVVDGRKRKVHHRRHDYGPASKRTFIKTVDPLNLTGKSGLFVLQKQFNIAFQAVYVGTQEDFPVENGEDYCIRDQLSFFNDPLTDPNFLMMIAMQGLEKKIKRPKIELLRVVGQVSGAASQLRELVNSTYQDKKFIAICDHIGPIGVTLEGSATSNLQYGPVAMGNRNEQPTITQVRIGADALPIFQYETNTQMNFGEVEPDNYNFASTLYQDRPCDFTYDFTDGAGHGLLLDNNALQVVTGWFVGGNQAQVTMNDDLEVKTRISFIYRVHYVELLQDEINALLERQNTESN